MTVLELTEHGTPLSVSLDDAVGRALARSRLVEAEPDTVLEGRWRVRAKGIVGVATVPVSGDDVITLRIAPKIPVARLLFLLGYSRGRRYWRPEHVQVDKDEELLPALARLFVLQADEAIRRGLLKGYRLFEDTALIMRGRVREAEQIRRHHGRLIPLEVAHDDYTADIAENRLLRTASDVLLRLPGVTRDVRGQILRLRVRLAEITPIGRGASLPSWHPSRLNARYHKALRLAELVLRAASVEHRPGTVTVHGFLVDMARVFEDFVTTALGHALAKSGGYCALQASHHLDQDNAIRMVPDFVQYAIDGTPLAVADAKYKAEKPEGFPHADLYQMLAYCTALNLEHGHLVYAKGDAPHMSHRIRNSGITIHQHALDLDQASETLLADTSALARRLAAPL
ncbi:McrC family protein [Actinokineospora iranica]|uniref:5-methylcytosine-specific restriction enzyme subunit McrC n=1 Tax=Actinokineospora iranica TaxID=1271860 RepID=A0A1G6VEI1_9PSEU|nr:restriction endonuclease [Actinokineospora iranica]SDD51417.1 5-methylcytosine-specific restriction enzyme subunit McrC [Actinokineospora iranica]